MSRRIRLLIASLFVIGLVVLGIFSTRWQPSIDRLLQPTGSEPAEEDVVVTLFFSDTDVQCLWAEPRTLPAGDDLPLRILEALAEGPQRDDLVATIPQGARPLSVTIRNGLAIVDYSAELRTNHPGGSAGELMTAYAIVGSLAALDEVDAVQILLEGHVIDSLVGHLIFSEPMTVSAEALQAGKICW